MVNSNGHNPYPSYPQAGPSHPMGAPQPPPGGYPGAPYPGAPGPHSRPEPPQRKGSTRTLPIVAGVGVAVGVFGGLMIIFGTGKSDASSTTTPVVTGSLDAGADRAAESPVDAGGIALAALAIDAGLPEARSRRVVLRFDVNPSDASITVDGVDVDGDSYTIELKKDQTKKVKIEARADGYRNWSKTIAVTADMGKESVAIELERRKRVGGGAAAGGGGGGGKGGGSGGKKGGGRGGSGGLIDL